MPPLPPCQAQTSNPRPHLLRPCPLQLGHHLRHHSASGPALPKDNDILTRLGIKRKEIKGQIKRTNWKQMPVTKLTEKAFWAQVDEEKMASQSLIEDL